MYGLPQGRSTALSIFYSLKPVDFPRGAAEFWHHCSATTGRFIGCEDNRVALLTWWLTRRRPHVLSPQVLWPDRVSPDPQERPRRRQTAPIRRRHTRPRREAGATRHPRGPADRGRP